MQNWIKIFWCNWSLAGHHFFWPNWKPDRTVDWEISWSSVQINLVGSLYKAKYWRLTLVMLFPLVVSWVVMQDFWQWVILLTHFNCDNPSTLFNFSKTQRNNFFAQKQRKVLFWSFLPFVSSENNFTIFSRTCVKFKNHFDAEKQHRSI